MTFPSSNEFNTYVLTFNSSGIIKTCPNWKRVSLQLPQKASDNEIADELENVAKQLRDGKGDRIRYNDETF